MLPTNKALPIHPFCFWTVNTLKKLFWVFPFLFLIDNILGLNGYQFTIFGVGIRIALFALTIVSMGLHCLLTMQEQSIRLFRRVPGQTRLWDYWKPIDWFVLGFLAVNCLWATAIPVLMQGNLKFALKDFSTVLVLVLYFPCAFLIRTGQLKLRVFSKWLYPLLLLLALWHSVMYIGESICPGFYESYYDFIDIISFGTAVRTEVVLGFGITRIIQVTSVLLIPAIVLTLERITANPRPRYFAALALVLFAILITYTKSIWFGVAAGLAVAGLGILIFCKDTRLRKRVLAFGGACVLLFCLFNFGFLHNTVITRTFSGIRISFLSSIDTQIANLQQQLSEIATDANEDAEELSDQLKWLQEQKQDISGTAEANAQRAQQKDYLLKKWSGSKLLGYGYGAYAEDCIRNETYPYMYENLLPALLMKLGLVGLLCWGMFVVALVVFAVKRLWNTPVTFWCWIGTALAYAMAVQTNPFLFTFAGMSLMLYLLLFLTGTPEES